MGKITETVSMLLLAAKLSFSFCWRNSKAETIGRLVVSLVITLSAYLTVQITGLIINAVQNSTEGFQVGLTMGLLDVFEGKLGIAIYCMVAVFLLGAIVGRFNWYYRSRWNQKLRYANNREINDSRAALDVGRFKSEEYDDLSKQITELPASWHTRVMFSDEMFTFVTTLVSFSLFGLSLLWYQPYYALILVVFAIPVMIADFHFVLSWWNLYKRIVPYNKERGVLEKPFFSPTTFTQAKMFNQMPTLRKQIDANTDVILHEYNAVRKFGIKTEMITRVMSVLALSGIIIHAIWQTIVTGGEIGTLTIIIAAARTFQTNLETLISSMSEQWTNARGVVLIERDFMGLKPLISTPNPIVPNFTSIPRITFDHVSFSYPNSEKLALDDVSFTVEPGEKLAIVGKSGSGKSTILALLMRYYDPKSGSVKVNEINLQNIEPHEWNRYVAALTQEYTVLERQIGAEIASSRLGQNPDTEDLIASTQFADFHDVVSSDPHGFESQIGVEFGGRDFSGGEKQRLALARAHYRGTPILILDEPDAKLDPDSAQRVIEQVFALKDVTVIMITHHVSRAEKCDRVLVMSKGQIVEQGTHEELMAQGGVYSTMSAQDKIRLGSES